MKHPIALLAALSLALMSLIPGLQAQNPVYDFVLLPGTDELYRPVFLTHAGDDRLFIVDQPGRIHIFQDGALLPEPFLDLEAIVDDRGNEEGLLGLAFHPDYAENGYFFLNYTAPDSSTRIARYQVSAEDPNLADPDSAVEVLRVEQPYDNHNGGMLAFGPDGYLYIGLGDGGSAGDPLDSGQTMDALLGKMLRLDVNTLPYLIPADNPYAESGNTSPEIWASGLRNPWRYSFDRATGDLFIADVGQNWIEEINFQPADSAGGENYGWRFFEGSNNFLNPPGDKSRFSFPIAQYTHDSGCSVTGGYVYRGAALPELDGLYFYGDYCSGVIWTLAPRGENDWKSQVWMRTNFEIASFGEDAAGELYLLSYGNLRGVYRLEGG
jgi:glucose/arabinose dehydrogenase